MSTWSILRVTGYGNDVFGVFGVLGMVGVLAELGVVIADVVVAGVVITEGFFGAFTDVFC
jgi:hypothetical protein